MTPTSVVIARSGVTKQSLRSTVSLRPSGQRNQRGRDGAAQQGFAGAPLGGGVEGFEKIHFAAGEERDRQAVAVEEPVAGQRGELWPRGQDAGEVEWVGAGKRDPIACRGFAADLA